jgi:hypothetical protein
VDAVQQSTWPSLDTHEAMHGWNRCAGLVCACQRSGLALDLLGAARVAREAQREVLIPGKHVSLAPATEPNQLSYARFVGHCQPIVLGARLAGPGARLGAFRCGRCASSSTSSDASAPASC